MNVSDHFLNPRHVGEMPDADVIAEETNPACGDRLRLYLKIRDGRIEASQFLAYGCPPTIACGSALTEMVTGKSLVEVQQISKSDVIETVGGLPARKRHAAALAIEALHAALDRWSQR